MYIQQDKSAMLANASDVKSSTWQKYFVEEQGQIAQRPILPHTTTKQNLQD
jgi:hypothetical protein